MPEDDKPQQRPGQGLGPDGKPCRVCTAFRAWRPNTKNVPRDPPKTSVPTYIGALAALGNAPTPTYPEKCPPDGEQLGRATWTFLHTTAAYYPERPDPQQRRRMHALLSALPTLYPCGHCAEHLGESMKAHPPDVSGRAALSLWLCERHNEVNEILGKAQFDCAKTDEQWREGPADGSCG